MRFAILRRRPICDAFLGIPLIEMYARDLLDALSSQHENSDGARVRRMDGRVGHSSQR